MGTSGPQYFFIIGAMKAGTTSLYKYLAGHPQLYASPRKEPRVFRDARTPDVMRREFLSLFKGRSNEEWCFEASTAYTKCPVFSGVPERIASVVPDARFVYLVRNPVERAWSQYVHNLAHGRETRSFSQAVAELPHYRDISRYGMQLNEFLAVFPRERVLVQVFEEMVKEPAATVRAVCEFLGVDASYTPPTGEVAFNVSSEKRRASGGLRLVQTLRADERIPWRLRHWLRERGQVLPSKADVMTPDLRASLVESLRPDTEAFFDLLGRRVTAWTDFADPLAALPATKAVGR
jgi:hypothetical protein